MKSNELVHFSSVPDGREPTPQGRAWAVSMAPAILALAVWVAQAEMVDDFEDPARMDQVWTRQCWFGSCSHQVTAEGQLRLAVTPTGDHGLATLRSVQRWTLQERRTQEFRVDLIRTSGDGAVVRMGFGYGDGARGYIMEVDQDSVAFGKRDNTPVEMFLRRNDLPIKATNVKLVLSVTGEPEGAVLIQVRILDNEQGGRVVYAEDVWDTAGADPMAVGPDDPPGSYLGMIGIFHLGVYHDNVGLIDPTVEIPPLSEAEVILDNAEVIEYDSAWIALPSKAILLSWPENTAEEQIVVGASSLDGPWTPWGEPIFRRHGAISMAVATIGTQQYFRVTPGTQYVDDFGDAKPPFASLAPWVPHFFNIADAARVSLMVTNGAFHIQTLSPAPLDGRIIISPPGSLPVFRDFTASVDILKFAVEQDHGIGIYARGSIDSPFPGESNGYIGQLYLNRIATWVGDHGVQVPFNCDPAAQYRLQFSAVGAHLTLRLVNRTTGETIEQNLTDTTFSQGYVMLAVPKLAPSQSFDIILDNFFVTGTKP